MATEVSVHEVCFKAWITSAYFIIEHHISIEFRITISYTVRVSSTRRRCDKKFSVKCWLQLIAVSTSLLVVICSHPHWVLRRVVDALSRRTSRRHRGPWGKVRWRTRRWPSWWTTLHHPHRLLIESWWEVGWTPSRRWWWNPWGWNLTRSSLLRREWGRKHRESGWGWHWRKVWRHQDGAWWRRSTRFCASAVLIRSSFFAIWLLGTVDRWLWQS